MRAMVVYESLYGNTRQVAHAIADGLAAQCDVELSEVGDAGRDLTHVDLLVAGGSTHAHGMMSERTRRGAVEDAEAGRDLVSTGPVLRDWIADVTPAPGAGAAAFDTRIGKPRWLTGSAGKGISRRLRERGFLVLGEPGSFLVDGGEGPLQEGELDRAREWAAELAAHPATDREPIR